MRRAECYGNYLSDASQGEQRGLIGKRASQMERREIAHKFCVLEYCHVKKTVSSICTLSRLRIGAVSISDDETLSSHSCCCSLWITSSGANETCRNWAKFNVSSCVSVAIGHVWKALTHPGMRLMRERELNSRTPYETTTERRNANSGIIRIRWRN